MSPIEEIETDLSWREAELAAIRSMLSDRRIIGNRRRALYRSAWTLLYAHFEGFSKFCWQIYLDELTRKCDSISLLPGNTVSLALEADIKRAKNLNSIEFVQFLDIGYPLLRSEAPSFPEVDTKSNLWPSVFEDILMVTSTKCDLLIQNRQMISTLVSRRNDIAHGKKVFIDDFLYYSEYEDIVISIMYDLALGIDEALVEVDRSFEPEV